MNLSLALVESDVRPALDAIFARVGVRPTAKIERELIGAEVWKTMERKIRESRTPQGFVWVGYECGWTALADESGHLAAQSEVWRALAQELHRRVLVLLADPQDEATGFALFFPDGTRRIVLHHHDSVQERGPRLPIEACFGDAPLSRDHLLLIAQTQGIDVYRLNGTTRFQLWETARPECDDWDC